MMGILDFFSFYYFFLGILGILIFVDRGSTTGLEPVILLGSTSRLVRRRQGSLSIKSCTRWTNSLT
uniref:Uncharacterized protein n=1 Tax=Arundo donax TaxID=35708 RepID=A0A0A9GYX5_ARUDO